MDLLYNFTKYSLALENHDEAKNDTLRGDNDHSNKSDYASLAVGIMEHTPYEYEHGELGTCT
jgi:hypothetical protein